MYMITLLLVQCESTEISISYPRPEKFRSGGGKVASRLDVNGRMDLSLDRSSRDGSSSHMFRLVSLCKNHDCMVA